MYLATRSRSLVLLVLGTLALALAWAVPVASVAAATPSVSAGYTVAISAATTSAHTRVSVPTLTCNPTASFMAAAAVAELLAPSNHLGGGLVLICANGAPTYAGFIQLNSTTSTILSDPVSPGDTIAATVSDTASAATVTVRDTTKGWTHTLSGGSVAGVAFGFVGVAAGNCTNLAMPCSPVPQVTAIQFHGATVDGQPVGAHQRAPSRSNIVSAAGLVEMTSGRLQAGGTVFTAHWRASCQPNPATNRC